MFSGIVIPRKEVTGELDNSNSVIELTQDWLTLCNSLKENTKAPPPSIGKGLTQSVYSLAVLFTWGAPSSWWSQAQIPPNAKPPPKRGLPPKQSKRVSMQAFEQTYSEKYHWMPRNFNPQYSDRVNLIQTKCQMAEVWARGQSINLYLPFLRYLLVHKFISVVRWEDRWINFSTTQPKSSDSDCRWKLQLGTTEVISLLHQLNTENLSEGTKDVLITSHVSCPAACHIVD